VFTEYKKGKACLLIMRKGLHKILDYSKVCAFLFHMSMVYTYVLIGSISEIYTYVLFDVASVDVYLCTCILCMSL